MAPTQEAKNLARIELKQVVTKAISSPEYRVNGNRITFREGNKYSGTEYNKEGNKVLFCMKESKFCPKEMIFPTKEFTYNSTNETITVRKDVTGDLFAYKTLLSPEVWVGFKKE